jgi:tetratricopeptide (TPR) repeat protein
MAENMRMGQRIAGILLFSLLGLMTLWILSRADLSSRLALNMQGIKLLKGGGQSEVEASLVRLTPRDCHAAWLLGAASAELGHAALRDTAWQETLRCSKASLPLVEILAPERDASHLAALAVELYPEEAGGWFWLARISAASDLEQAARYAWQGLEISPHDGLGWRMLSDTLAKLEPVKALSLYEEFGLHDIGSHDALNQDEALFLFGRILSKEAPERAVALYQQGLTLNPYDGVRWRELGDLLRDTDSEAAKEAYYQSCRYGDPGSHGCLEAGRIAEEQGNLEEAIRFYKLSLWQPVLDRANMLEKQLETQQP